MKVTKQTYDFIKVSLNVIPVGIIIKDFKISISTINKIKRSSSYEEYKKKNTEIKQTRLDKIKSLFRR